MQGSNKTKYILKGFLCYQLNYERKLTGNSLQNLLIVVRAGLYHFQEGFYHFLILQRSQKFFLKFFSIVLLREYFFYQIPIRRGGLTLTEFLTLIDKTHIFLDKFHLDFRWHGVNKCHSEIALMIWTGCNCLSHRSVKDRPAPSEVNEFAYIIRYCIFTKIALISILLHIGGTI